MSNVKHSNHNEKLLAWHSQRDLSNCAELFGNGSSRSLDKSKRGRCIFHSRSNIGSFLCWLVISNSVGGLWKASLAGAFLFLIDHVLFKGGFYLWVYFFSPSSLPFDGLMSFWGVLISYAMFIWLPMVLACFGGIASNYYLKYSRLTHHSSGPPNGAP